MFEIKKEILMGAEDYLPLAEKEKISQEIAMHCINSISYHLEVGGVRVDVPDYHGRNTALRERYLLGVLLIRYLGMVRFEPVEGTKFLLSLDDYDRAARLHPLNALERLKSDPEAREKVFDLLRDYKLLCDMTRSATEDLTAAQNDPVQRYLAAQAAAVTPEALKALTDAEAQLKGQIEEMKKAGKDVSRIFSDRKTTGVPPSEPPVSIT